jgi:hypothetical protein
MEPMLSYCPSVRCIQLAGDLNIEHQSHGRIDVIRIPPPPGGTAILPEYIHYYG